MINSVIEEINSGVVQKVVLSRLKELHVKEKINLKVDLASKASKEKLEKIGATLNLKQKK